MLGINFASGKVVFEEFHICFSKPYSEQLDALSEDLVQVVYGDNYILDIGWYPERNKDGNFAVQIIGGKDWENPIFKKCCREKDVLTKYIHESIEVVEGLIRKRT